MVSLRCIAINDIGSMILLSLHKVHVKFVIFHTHEDNAMLPTYGCDQSIQDDVQELVHEPLQMNEVELSQSENQWSDQGVQIEDSEEEGSEEIEEDDNDEFVEDDSSTNDDSIENDSGEDDDLDDEDDNAEFHNDDGDF
nr:uncharacterized protein LOC109157962 [Ipomoea trifida]